VSGKEDEKRWSIVDRIGFSNCRACKQWKCIRALSVLPF